MEKIKIVVIGSQEWMVKNLDVSTFRKGEPIPEAKTIKEWDEACEKECPAWCYYNNDPNNGKIYGKLYNYYAVWDPRDLAPTGFHIASDLELDILIKTLGGKDNAGPLLKNNIGWGETGNGSNISGFSALSGGACHSAGFYSLGIEGWWWSMEAAPVEDERRGEIVISNMLDVASHENGEEEEIGLSVRCIKDSEY